MRALLIVVCLLLSACGPTRIQAVCSSRAPASIEIHDLVDGSSPRAGFVQVVCGDGEVIAARACRYEAIRYCDEGNVRVVCMDAPSGPATIFEGDACR